MANADFWTDGTIPWLSSKEVVGGTITEVEKWVTSKALQETSLRLNPAGAVVIVVRSGILLHTFPVAYVPFDCAINQDLKVGIPNDSVDGRFLLYLLDALGPDLLRSYRKTGTTVQSINVPALLQHPVSLPPLSVQRRIVDLMAHLDAHIANLRAEERALSVLVKAQRRSVFSRESERKSFSQVAVLQRGYDLPVQNRTAGQIPVVASNGVVGTHGHAKVSGPGVITGRSGTIGKVMWLEGDYWPLNTTLYVKDFKGNEPRYVRWLLESMNLASHAGGSTVPSLNRNVLDEISVFCPPLETQRQEADVLDDIEGQLEAMGEEVRRLSDLRDTVLSDLLSRRSHALHSSDDSREVVH